MDRNGLPLDPCHLGVPSGVSKIISEPVVRSVQTMPLSCTETNMSPNGLKWDSAWPTSPRSSIGCVQTDFRFYGTFSANCAPILHQDYHYLQIGRNELPLEPHYLGVPLGVSKTIFEPIVRSAQTVHLYCINISTISKPTETSFHLSHMTWEYHRVRPKWFLSLWYIWCKPCTYLALILTLSLKGPTWDSTWPTHLGVPSGASKMIFEPMVPLV
jgi:hypothetical protein